MKQSLTLLEISTNNKPTKKYTYLDFLRTYTEVNEIEYNVFVEKCWNYFNSYKQKNQDNHYKLSIVLNENIFSRSNFVKQCRLLTESRKYINTFLKKLDDEF